MIIYAKAFIMCATLTKLRFITIYVIICTDILLAHHFNCKLTYLHEYIYVSFLNSLNLIIIIKISLRSTQCDSLIY